MSRSWYGTSGLVFVVVAVAALLDGLYDEAVVMAVFAAIALAVAARKRDA